MSINDPDSVGKVLKIFAFLAVFRDSAADCTKLRLVLKISKLDEIPNIGTTSIQEIKEKLIVWMRDNIQDVPKSEEKETDKPILTGDKNITLEDLYVLAEGDAKEQLSNTRVHVLNLPTRVQNPLVRKGIYTLYDLVVRLSELRNINNIGAKALQNVNEELLSWARANLHKSSHQAEAPLLATERSVPKKKQAQITDMLSALKPRQREVLSLLLGLSHGHTMTLQEAADQLGLSRERIRQIKSGAIYKLRKASPLFVNLAFFEKAAEYISRRGGVVSEIRLTNDMNGDAVLCNYQASGILEILKELDQDFLQSHLIFIPFIEAWTTPSFLPHLIEPTAAEIQRIIEGIHGGLAWKALYTELQSHEDLFALDEDLALAIAVCLEDLDILECSDDGRWMTKNSRNHQRRAQVINVLVRIGRPAHFREISRALQGIFPEGEIDDHAVHAILGRYTEIFSRVGRGLYGLVQWGLNNDGSIANTVRRILADKGEPMSFAEISIEVLKTWQVEEYSIYSAILQDARFAQKEDGKFVLTEIGYAIKKINKRSDEKRGDRLVEVLKAINSPLHYKILTKEHNERYLDKPLTESAVSSILNTNPDVFVRINTGVFGLAEWGLEAKADEIKLQDRLIIALKHMGRPATSEELFNTIKQLFPDIVLSKNTINFHIYKLMKSDNPAFFRVSRGVYGLVGWEGISILEKPTILKSEKSLQDDRFEKVIGILKVKKEPLTVGELRNDYEKLYPDQPINRGAIYSLLKKRVDIFVKYPRGQYGLAEWGEMQLTRKDDQEKSTKRTDTRLDRVLHVFHEYNQPTNVKLILKRYNELYPDKALKENHLYSVFFKHKEMFTRVQKSEFALTEWGCQPLPESSKAASSAGRRDRLIPIIRELNRPASVKELRELHNSKHPNYPLSQQTTYETMFKYPETFRRVGKGVFTLVNG